jgi:hypothetical protein
MAKKGKTKKGKKVLKKNPQKYSSGRDIPRTEVIIVANSKITDWGGTFLDPEIRNHFEVGNIVRIALGEQGSGHLDQVMYFRITEVIGRDRYGLLFRGVCDDGNYGHSEYSYTQNGHQRVFSARSVTEAPLTWPCNANLEKVAEFRNKRLVITGV